jgi:LuxR family maltose regulon positive regulatory protein
MLTQGDVPGAVNVLAEAEAFVQRQHFKFRMPDVAAAQVLILLRQSDLVAAATLAQKYELPLSQARVYLAQGDPTAALAVLEPLRQQMEAMGWRDEQLKIMLLQAVAHDADGEKNKAMQQLAEALALAEPEGFIRIFADEGLPMEHLLSEAATRGMMPDYVSKLLAVFEVEKQEPVSPPAQALVDPLSERELEILTLIAAGLKNKEIAEQLFISLNTVLYHVKNIYSKLGVKKRTLAIIKARELNLLPAEQNDAAHLIRGVNISLFAPRWCSFTARKLRPSACRSTFYPTQQNLTYSLSPFKPQFFYPNNHSFMWGFIAPIAL